MQYELLFLVGRDKEADLESIEKSVEGFVGEIGGEMLASRWESKRRLAYPIKHQDRGAYIARRFTLPEIDMWADDATEEDGTDRIEKLSRTLRLFDGVLRFSIVRAEELEDLESFASRKEEERKSHKQAVEKKEQDTKTRRPASPVRPSLRPAHTGESTPVAPVAQSVAPVAPKKEVSVAEINDTLDEILNG